MAAECAAKCEQLAAQLYRVHHWGQAWWVCSVRCAFQLGRRQRELELQQVIDAGHQALIARACACGHSDDIHLDLEGACQALGCECQRFCHWKKRVEMGPHPAGEKRPPNG